MPLTSSYTFKCSNCGAVHRSPEVHNHPGAVMDGTHGPAMYLEELKAIHHLDYTPFIELVPRRLDLCPICIAIVEKGITESLYRARHGHRMHRETRDELGEKDEAMNRWGSY